MSISPSVFAEALENAGITNILVQKNGGGNVTLIFRIGGYYYDISSLSPAYEPLDPTAVIAITRADINEVRARCDELRSHRLAQNGHLTRPELCELGILEELLCSPHTGIEPGPTWSQIGSANDLAGLAANDRRYYDWSKTFAAVWRMLEERYSQH